MGDFIKEVEMENGWMMEWWNGEMLEWWKLIWNFVKDGMVENYLWMVFEFVYVLGWLLGVVIYKF